MKYTIILALISTLLMFISFFIGTVYIHYYLIGGFWFIFQFVAIYMDYSSHDRLRNKVVEVGFWGWLMGGWHVNARLWYIVNGLFLILGYFLFDIIFFVFASYYGFGAGLSFNTFSNPIIIIWGISSVINIFTGLRAKPPRKVKSYKNTCEHALYNYLGKNQGKAFSVKALSNRIKYLNIKAKERKYCRKNLQELLSNLRSDAKIDSTVKDDELFYLIPDGWAL